MLYSRRGRARLGLSIQCRNSLRDQRWTTSFSRTPARSILLVVLRDRSDDFVLSYNAALPWEGFAAAASPSYCARFEYLGEDVTRKKIAKSSEAGLIVRCTFSKTMIKIQRLHRARVHGSKLTWSLGYNSKSLSDRCYCISLYRICIYSVKLFFHSLSASKKKKNVHASINISLPFFFHFSKLLISIQSSDHHPVLDIFLTHKIWIMLNVRFSRTITNSKWESLFLENTR